MKSGNEGKIDNLVFPRLPFHVFMFSWLKIPEIKP
jgi:hypothetical protein